MAECILFYTAHDSFGHFRTGMVWCDDFGQWLTQKNALGWSGVTTENISTREFIANMHAVGLVLRPLDREVWTT